MTDSSSDGQYVADVDFEEEEEFTDDDCLLDIQEKTTTQLTNKMNDLMTRLEDFDREKLERIILIKRDFYLLCEDHRYIIEDSGFLQKLEMSINDRISYYEDKLFKLTEEMIDKEEKLEKDKIIRENKLAYEMIEKERQTKHQNINNEYGEIHNEISAQLLSMPIDELESQYYNELKGIYKNPNDFNKLNVSYNEYKLFDEMIKTSSQVEKGESQNIECKYVNPLDSKSYKIEFQDPKLRILLNLKHIKNKYMRKWGLPPIIYNLTNMEQLIAVENLTEDQLQNHSLFIQKQLEEKDHEHIIRKISELNRLKEEYSSKSYKTDYIHIAYTSIIAKKEFEVKCSVQTNNLIANYI